MKRTAVHTLFSNWKHKMGSQCTCCATAFWSIPHRSLSISPERQQPWPTAVQQPPSQHLRPSHISSLAHSFSWKVTVSGYTYCGVSIKGFLPLCVPLYRKQNFSKASLCTLIITWGLKLLQPISLWVASWEDSMALRLIFTKNKHRERKWKIRDRDWKKR